MALTRDFNQTVRDRAQRDPAFAQALRDEAKALALKGEPGTAQRMLGELLATDVDGPIGIAPGKAAP